MRKLSAFVLLAFVWLTPTLYAQSAQESIEINNEIISHPESRAVNMLEATGIQTKVNNTSQKTENTDNPEIKNETVQETFDKTRKIDSSHVASWAVKAFTDSASVSASDSTPKQPKISSYAFGSAPPPEGVGRKITVTAYAYCLNGYTACGTPTNLGTVAVDPNLIRIGSKIYIPGYGWGKALDTGGAIYGNSIDIWLPSTAQCHDWGVRTITVTVVE